MGATRQFVPLATVYKAETTLRPAHSLPSCSYENFFLTKSVAYIWQKQLAYFF